MAEEKISSEGLLTNQLTIKRPPKMADRGGCGCRTEAEEKSLPHAGVDAVVFAGAEVLPAVGCHCGAECRHGLGRDIADLGGRGEGGDHTRAKHVDRTLHNHGANGGN